MSKLTRELNTEELLKALENKKEEVVEQTEYSNDVLAFLHFFDIKNGNEKINKSLLRRVYTQWSDKPMGRHAFFIELANFLEPASDRCYSINHNSLDIAASGYRYLLENRKRNKTLSPKWKAHFESFMSYYSLDRGAVWVPGFVLFHLYDKWTYKNKATSTLTESYFQMFCGLYFKKKRLKGTYLWYRVSQNILNGEFFSYDQMKAMIQTRDDHGKKTTGKKRKAKKETSV